MTKRKLILILFILWCVWQVQANSLSFTKSRHIFENDLAGNSQGQQQIPVTLPNTYIIKFKPLKSKNREDLRRYVESKINTFTERMKRLQILLKIIHAYIYVFPGISIVLEDPTKILLIEKLILDSSVDDTEISMILPDDFVYPLETDTPLDIWDYPIAEMNAPQIIQEQLLSGKGLTVAVLDEGIQYTETPFIVPGKKCQHLKDEGCRVKLVEDFIKPKNGPYIYNSGVVYRPGYQEGRNVYGTHGTKVANLIGGTAPFSKGMATEVEFYDYRMLEKTGSSSILAYAAIDLAIHDNVDVICISFGNPSGNFLGLPGTYYKEDAQEIFITSGVGNAAYQMGHFKISTYAEFPQIMGVGNFKIPYSEKFIIHFQIISPKFGTIGFLFKEIGIKRGFYSLLKAPQVKYFILSKERPMKFMGLNYFSEPPKDFFVIIVCDNIAVCKELLEVFANKRIIPSAFIFSCPTALDVERLGTFNVPLGQVETKIEEFNHIVLDTLFSSFQIRSCYVRELNKSLAPDEHSSLGPALWNFGIKPDVSLPGGNLLVFKGSLDSRANSSPKPASAYKYTVSSGTSFSNGYMAGLATLFMSQCKKDGTHFGLEEFLARVQNSAKPYFFSEEEFLSGMNVMGYAHSVSKQGAGLIQADAVLNGKVVIMPSKLELQQVDPATDSKFHLVRYLSIKNQGTATVVYKIYNVPSVASCFDERIQGVRFKKEKLLLQFHSNAFVEGEDPNMLAIQVPAMSTVLNIVRFYVYPDQSHLTFLNGYIQFIPIRIIPNEGEPVNPRLAEEYSTLNVPYSLFYGNFNLYPIYYVSGVLAPFLTDLRVKDYVSDYLNYYSLFPKYFNHINHEISPIDLTFRLYGISRPVISLCFTVPIESVTFYLYNAFLPSEAIGNIAKYRSLSDSCYLFLLRKSAVAYGSADFPPDYMNGHMNFGWKGTYHNRDKSMQMVQNGFYYICAEIRRKFESSPTQFQRWCTPRFFIILPPPS